MGKKLFFTLIVLAFISVLAGKMSPDQELQAAQPATEPEVTEDPLYAPLVRNFDTFVQQGMAASQIPGVAVAIVRENDIIFLQGFGNRAGNKSHFIDQAPMQVAMVKMM